MVSLMTKCNVRQEISDLWWALKIGVRDNYLAMLHKYFPNYWKRVRPLCMDEYLELRELVAVLSMASHGTHPSFNCDRPVGVPFWSPEEIKAMTLVIERCRDKSLPTRIDQMCIVASLDLIVAHKVSGVGNDMLRIFSVVVVHWVDQHL